VREGSCLSVIDSHSGSVLTLPNADLRTNGVYGQHRAATFSPDGKRMAYLRGGGATETIVVRELRTGTETEYPCPEHLIFDMRFDAAGEWLMLDLTDADDVPRFLSTRSSSSCPSRPEPITDWVRGSLRLDRDLLRVSDGTTVHDEDLVTPFGNGILVRTRTGSINFRAVHSLEERELVPNECSAQLLHADPTRGLVLVLCDDSPPASGSSEGGDRQSSSRTGTVCRPLGDAPVAYRSD